ncbi:hypothetical protein D3C81_1547710 [compost metagenome]
MRQQVTDGQAAQARHQNAGVHLGLNQSARRCAARTQRLAEALHIDLAGGRPVPALLQVLGSLGGKGLLVLRVVRVATGQLRLQVEQPGACGFEFFLHSGQVGLQLLADSAGGFDFFLLSVEQLGHASLRGLDRLLDLGQFGHG